MIRHHPFKKAKPGEPILVTARQLESFMLEHNGKFNLRDYDKFEHMELTESPVRDAIHELKTYSPEILAQRFDARLLRARYAPFSRGDNRALRRFHSIIVDKNFINQLRRKLDHEQQY